MIGVIYSIAARACSASLSRDDDSHDNIIQTMFRARLDCRRIAKDIAPFNDALLWLTYETVTLSSCVLAHSSEIVWCRVGDLPKLILARQKLTPDGWNSEGIYTITAWTRVRSVLSTIREDILEYKFKPTTAESQMRLDSKCEQLLVYGRPSIAILTTALRDISRGTQIAQAYSSRTTLIRNLAVCISHLESFSEAPEIYHALCTKASNHISRAMEEVLEPSNAVATRTEERSTLSPLNANGKEANIQPWIAELDLLNPEVFDNFDISTWRNDLEYTGAIGGWTIFELLESSVLPKPAMRSFRLGKAKLKDQNGGVIAVAFPSIRGPVRRFAGSPTFGALKLAGGKVVKSVESDSRQNTRTSKEARCDDEGKPKG
ncbi:hypothetical protein BDV96DRAFT_605314 [Lophiotrema nucula]|uniref:Uncharacterized protein n=1 Tax=Lophiotrema nucula TaxID=690887 RepID=A0A6A5YPG4_9PLEO|nr:hypothetical protein BDV96DRAFT_605314 [Lophiotrema nucula]